MSIPNTPITSNTSDSIRAYGPWIIAVIILFGYGFFMDFMMGKTGVGEDNEWTRLTYLFSSVEGIVFTAVGFIFGREVNRSRAVNAEQNEVKAKQETKELAQEVMKNVPSTSSVLDSATLESQNLGNLRILAEKYFMK